MLVNGIIEIKRELGLNGLGLFLQGVATRRTAGVVGAMGVMEHVGGRGQKAREKEAGREERADVGARGGEKGWEYECGTPGMDLEKKCNKQRAGILMEIRPH
jgi:hypothetical protein